MAYLGKAPVNGFHAKQQLTGDGSTVTFTLDQTVATETSIIVSVGGVLQEPAVGFNLGSGGTVITFTEAPSSTDRVYVQFLGTAIVQNLLDVNGAEFVLDVDADTSFTADTDDEIDIKVGGSDRSTIKATGFHNLDSIKYVAGTGDDLQLYHDGTNSYLANSTGALKIATETSGIAITLGHSTSEVTVADNLTVTGTLTVGGTVNFGDFDISNVGSIALDTITNDGTDITLDSSGDIILDSDGADIIFKDAGTEISRFTNSSSDFIIQTAVSDKDFIIKGNDGGATITPFTIDMSAGGDLFLTGGLIDLKNDGSAVSQIKFYCESSNAHAQTLIGAPHSESATNTLTLPSTGGNSYLVSAASTATLTNKTLTSPQITTSIIPSSADGAAIGSASAEFSDLFLADASTIQFGNDQEVRLIHNADKGLILKHTATADDKPVSLTLQTGETDIAANDVIGQIDFQAPDEGTGTDAILVAAGIAAISEGDFSSSSNATKLSFKTGVSEAASEKMSLSSAGLLTVADDIVFKDGGTIGVSSAVDAMTVSSAGIVTFKDDILIKDGGTIGSASDADAITISSGGVVTMNQIPVFSAGINVSGGSIAGTLSTAAQANITSLGTLTTLTIDNVIINGTTIGHTSDTDLITIADGIATVAGEVSMTTLDIGGTNVTSTAAELNYVDGVTSNVQTQLDTKTTTGKAVAFALVFG